MDQERENIFNTKLPEIKNRNPYEIPTKHLIRKQDNDWMEIDGRRESKTLIANKIRYRIDEWRKNGYVGISNTSRRLLGYWFEEEHILSDGQLFKFYFCQREAIETIIYLYELENYTDTAKLIKDFLEIRNENTFPMPSLQIIKTSQGQRKIRRYIDEVGKYGEQDIPPEDLTRYAIKMATGTGKTIVMALLVAWSCLHKKFEENSTLADNFLIIAPNVIVYERLKTDFENAKIFIELPIIPPEWKYNWNIEITLRNDSIKSKYQGNIFLTNIQRLYEIGEKNEFINPLQAMLGKSPNSNIDVNESLLDRIKSLNNLMVINDEAHHVHDDDLAWNKTLLSLHETIRNEGNKGITMWIDFSATPKNQNGTYFPWIIVDYPLAQATEDRIVKIPLIVHDDDRKDPGKHKSENAGDVYNQWIVIAVERWREHNKEYRKYGIKPVLFIMTEDTIAARSVAERLRREPEFKSDGNLLIIHTDKEGNITKSVIDEARKAVNNIDDKKSRVKAVVSVMMLREGWDVRNVTIILGLRPFTSKANILPEQAIGRGLRLIRELSKDNNQILELIGTPAFEEFVSELEKEGVGIATVKKPPKIGVQVYPLEERKLYDISIPITTPMYIRNYKELSKIDPSKFNPIINEDLQNIELKKRISLVHGIVNVKVADSDIEYTEDNTPPAESFLSELTNRIMRNARITGCFADLYPKVRLYVEKICFGREIDLDNIKIRIALNNSLLLDSISTLFSVKIGQLTSISQEINIYNDIFLLSQVKPFLWRREAVQVKHSIFNLAACHNYSLEGRFAEFLDRCADVIKFAKLAEWFTEFYIDYLSSSGGMRYYYPDFVVVQNDHGQEINWIVETKGREDNDVPLKDAHMNRWCEQVTQKSGNTWKYMKVLQKEFECEKYESFRALVKRLNEF